MASKASAAEASDPSKLIGESFVVVGDMKTEGYSRTETVSMGDPEKYDAQGGIFTFRGGPLRQNAAYGTVEVNDGKLVKVRAVRTGRLGDNYTGFGYGSQPLIVKWYSNIRKMLNIDEASRDTTALKEVIFPADDGKIYFINLDTQTFTRDAIDIGLPMGVTASVNPYGYPILYIGQTVESISEYSGVLGMRMYNLIDQSLLAFRTGYDENALAQVGTIPSSPLVETGSDTLIYSSDNGMVYTVSMNTQFDMDNASLAVSPQVVSYGYKSSGRNAKTGIPSSLAAYGDYVFFGDLNGTLQCVDMNTMQPVWALDMEDSVVANVSLECGDNGEVYLYAGNVINKRERSGQIKLVKIDAMTGTIIWECQSTIRGKYASKDAANGIYAGLMASPLVGKGDISDLVIFNVNHVDEDGKNKTFYSIVYALDKETGEEVWKQPLYVDSMSSPIALYQPDGKSYVVMGDNSGILRLMDGFTGTTIDTINLEGAITGSPAAYNNRIVVGTKTGMIWFVDVQ